MTESRVRVSVGLTLPLGPYASRRIDVGVEKDAGIDYAAELHGVRLELEKELEDFKTQFKTVADLPTSSSTTLPVSSPTPLPKTSPTPITPQVHTPVSTEIPVQPGSLATYTLEQLAADLDKLTWIQQQSKKGYWIFWDNVPERTRQKLEGMFKTEASPRGYVKLDSYNYARGGDGGTFLNRYAIRPAAMEAQH